MQRVAIGRALVREPAIYLMDEPLSSLDAKLRADLRLELKRIQHDLGATMLYVTHDQIEAMTMADRIGVLDRRPAGAGRHAARDLRGPADQRRRGAARLAAHQPGAARARSARGRRRRRRSTVGVRAEHLHVHAAADGAAPRCARRCGGSSILSDQRLVHLALADSAAELISAAPARGSVEPGERGRRRARPAALVRRRRPARRRLTGPTMHAPEPAPWTT